MKAAKRKCWCGNDSLTRFSDDYLHCAKCETLVLRNPPENVTTRVESEDDDLYGKNYYLKHLIEDYGYPDLQSRARADLSERCIHWLETLLKFKRPGAKLLEAGCSHGGSVALFRMAGYDATGLELSPWLVRFARELWDIPVLEGPLEDQKIAKGSLDIVTMFDVIEHLLNPVATIRKCKSLLAGNGIIVLQTPCYPAGFTYDSLVKQEHAFIVHLKPAEHIYLFSKAAMKKLLKKAGFNALSFEEPIFAHYDQYIVASPGKTLQKSAARNAKALEKNRTGRIVRALVDVNDRARTLATQVKSRDEQLLNLDADLRKVNEIARKQAHVHEREFSGALERAATAEILAKDLSKSLHSSEKRAQKLDKELARAFELARDQEANLSARLEQALASAEAAATESRKAHEQLAELDETRKSLERDLQAANKRITGLDSDLAKANQTAAAEIGKLQQQLSASQDGQAALEKQLQDSNEKVAKLDESLTDANRLARQQIQELQSVVSGLQCERDEFQKNLQSADSRAAELDEMLKTANTHATEQIKILNERLQRTDLARKAAEESAQTANLQVADLDERLLAANKVATEQIQSLHRRLLDSDRQRESLERENHRANEKIAKLDLKIREINKNLGSELQETRQRLAASDRLRDDTEKQLQDANSRLAALDAQLHEVNIVARAQINESRTEIEASHQLNRELQSSLVQADTRIAELDETIASISQESREEQAKLHKRLELSEAEKRNLGEELQRTRTRLAELDGQLAALNEFARTQARAASEEWEALNQAHHLATENHKKQIAELQNDLEQRNTRIAKLQQELTKLKQSKWSRLGTKLRLLPESNRNAPK